MSNVVLIKVKSLAVGEIHFNVTFASYETFSNSETSEVCCLPLLVRMLVFIIVRIYIIMYEHNINYCIIFFWFCIILKI